MTLNQTENTERDQRIGKIGNTELKTKTNMKIEKTKTSTTESSRTATMENTDKKTTEKAHRELKEMEIGIICPDPDQPRKEFAKEKLEEMRDSIREHGILQPLIVRPGKTGYTLVSGERRLRGAKLAGLKTVPVIVRELDEKQVFAMQMIENLQRENLTALEEAAALQRRVQVGAKAEDLAKELGISRATVFGRLRLMELDGETRKAVVEGRINVSVAGLAAMVPTEERGDFLEEVAGNEYAGPWTFRQAQDEVERYVRQLKDAGFDPKKDYGAGKMIVCAQCEACPKRSGNMEASGLKSPNVCTGPECYQEKTRLAAEEQIAAAKAKNLPVLSVKENPFDDRGTLPYNSVWVDLKNRCEELGWDYKNHWKAALGGHCPAVTIAIDAQGKAHELVNKVVARDALMLTEAWKKASKRNNGGDSDRYEAARRAAEKKKLERRKKMHAVTQKVTPLILSKANFGVKEWAAVLARAAYAHASQDECGTVAKRRGLTEKQTEARDVLTKWLKQPHETKEWLQMAAELLLCGDPYQTAHWMPCGWMENYKAAAALAGANVEKMEKGKAKPELNHKGTKNTEKKAKTRKEKRN